MGTTVKRAKHYIYKNLAYNFNHRKIEPLLGMQPRTAQSAVSGLSSKALVICGIGFVCAVVAELAATAGMSLIEWEADWAESGTAVAVGMVVAAVVAIAVIAYMKKASERKVA